MLDRQADDLIWIVRRLDLSHEGEQLFEVRRHHHERGSLA
jgi:hypothetical protein